MNIKENIDSWNAEYDWSHKGEEWSEPWGSSAAEWVNLIYPRISRFLPADKILEIGPGNGRWINFLKKYTRELSGVDLSQKCISYCKKRFKNNNNLKFYLNDGLSLSVIEDDSIDFIFSFDSLVHADLYIIESYLKEIGRILKKDGAAFIHHSNLLDCKKSEGLREHARSLDVDYKLVRSYSKKSGLYCMVQELVNWRNPEDFLTDCFSTFIKNESSRIDCKLFRNNKFMEYAKLIKTFSYYYK